MPRANLPADCTLCRVCKSVAYRGDFPACVACRRAPPGGTSRYDRWMSSYGQGWCLGKCGATTNHASGYCNACRLAGKGPPGAAAAPPPGADTPPAAPVAPRPATAPARACPARCEACDWCISGVPGKTDQCTHHSLPPPHWRDTHAERSPPQWCPLRPANAPALADYAADKAAAVNDSVDAPATTLDRLSESVIQAECERWAEWRGYWRRSRKNLDAAPPPRGWQYHLHRCEENPPLLDILLLANDGRYLEVELKTATGRATIEQRAILQGREVCRSLAEFQGVVEQWEAGAGSYHPTKGE